MTFRLDHIAQQLQLDASETAFFERQLLAIRSGVFTKQFAELKAMSFLPPEPNLNIGAKHFTYQYTEHYGTVVLGSDMSQPGPNASLTRAEATPIPFRDITNSYRYDVQEIRAAMMARQDLAGDSAVAARKAIEQFRDNLLLLGDGTWPGYFGCYGLFALSGTHTYTATTGAAASKTFGLKTPDEVVADLHGICNGIMTNSSEVENPDTLLLPLTSYVDVASRRMGDGSNETILSFFLKVRQGMRPGFTVDSSVKLETAGANSTKRMVAYEKSREKVARLDSIEFEQFAPQVQGYNTITNCHARTAGVYTAFPKSISYSDGI